METPLIWRLLPVVFWYCRPLPVKVSLLPVSCFRRYGESAVTAKTDICDQLLAMSSYTNLTWSALHKIDWVTEWSVEVSGFDSREIYFFFLASTFLSPLSRDLPRRLKRLGYEATHLHLVLRFIAWRYSFIHNSSSRRGASLSTQTFCLI